MVPEQASSDDNDSKAQRARRFKAGQVTLAPGQPFTITDVSLPPRLSASQRKTARQIASVIKAYLEAGHDLLSGTYSGVKELAPAHLAGPSRVLVNCCKNGVIIRYEGSQDGKDHVFVGFAKETAEQLAHRVSESVIYCVPKGTELSSIDTSSSPKLELFVKNSSTAERRVVTEFRISYLCTVEEPGGDPSTPSGKPFRLLGVENHFELQLLAEEVDEKRPRGQGRQFVTRSTIRLPVGWEYIEVYPNVDLKHWKKEFARSWAENDILGRVMGRQLREQHFRALDPNVDARKHLARLLDEYKILLDSDPQEEVLQEFLRKNPAFLSPTHMRFWPKVAFGDKVSDFVFQEADGDYLLVEIERPSKKLFLKNGDTSRWLNHAQNQITDWKRYIQDNLKTVQAELRLEGISPNPKSLIVMGRSSTVSEKGRRKLVTIRSDNPRQSIMTYDDVLENAKAAIENILGPLWAASGSAEVYFLREGPKAAGPE